MNKNRLVGGIFFPKTARPKFVVPDKNNFTKVIFVLEDATKEDMVAFQKKICDKEKYLIANSKIKMFKIINGKKFEVVSSLKEVKEE